jgi:Sulfatase
VTPPRAVRAGKARSGWRKEVGAFAELLALCGFAFAQPLLDLFGRNPTQFVFRNAETFDIIAFAFVIAFVPPLALWTAEAIIGRFAPRLRSGVHLAFVAVLVGAFVMQAARGLATRAPLLVLAAVLAAGAVLLRERAAAARLWLSYAALAPVAFVALFLLASDTSRLIFENNARAAEAGVGKPAPVVMIVFDEFPLTSIIDADGHIDRDLYPNIAAFADDSSWFRNATSVSSSTWYAVPSIATGRYPHNGDAPVAADYPQSLFTLLGDAYEMQVTESITRLCPANICRPTLPSGSPERQLLKDAVKIMRSRLSYSGAQGDPVAGLVERPAVDTPGDDGFADFGLNQPERFVRLIGGLEDDTAALHYLHILLPHVPYRYLPAGAQYASPDPDLGRVKDDWSPEPWLAKLGRQRLQLQVGYVDRLIGALMARLRERGIYDDALVVITADHGISFEPGGPIRAIEGQSMNARARSELGWVPLFVKRPGQVRGEVSDANVQTIDVLPTVADVLDVKVPWSVDGQSVFGPPRPDNRKPFFPSDVNAFGVDASEPITIDGDAGWRGVLDQAVDTVLPRAGGSERLWRIGPSAQLVGAYVDTLPPGSRERLNAVFDDANALQTVDPASGKVPALIRGAVDGVAAGDPLAIAVNGVVGATAPAYADGGAVKFAAMVDGALFRAGANDVAIYRLRE